MKKRKIFQMIRDMKIRTKLLLVYAVLLVITVTFGSLAVYLVVRGNIRQSMENELVNTTEALRNMVRAAATTAVKTHLRGIAEERLHDIEDMYSLVAEEKLTKAEARTRISKMLLADVIGKTGYIFVWDVSRAPESIPLVVHPYIQGEDVAYVDFVQKAARLKKGYIEYDWKNPHEIDTRKKSMYIVYFEPWDWVLAAASYREEFLDLVDIADFQDFIAPMKFAESGYSFIFDTRGNSVFHPFASGNVYDANDSNGHYFVREMCEKRNGIITYSLQNPGDDRPRRKLTAYRYIPEYEWIVASSSYLDEIYAPLKKLTSIILMTALLSVVIMLPIMLWVSSLLTRQLTRLVKGFAKGSSGDLSVRIVPRTMDEIGQLTRYFNAFMGKLEEYHISLRNEMNEKTKTAARLETFGKFAQAAGQGFFMTDLDGRVTYANPAMCVITGCDTTEELVGKNILDFYENIFNDILHNEIRPVLKRKSTWSGELELKTHRGRKIDVIQNIFLIRDNLGKARLFATVLTDITERKRTENIIKGQKERIQEQYVQLANRNQELVSTHKRLLESNLALSREKELIAITLRSIADGVITTDAKGHVTLMNHTAEIITGVKADNIAGSNVKELLKLVSEKDGLVLENPAIKALKAGAVGNPGVDALIIDEEGSPKYVVATAAPVYDADKTLSGAVLVVRDVTERRKMEKELIKTMKIESLGVFAGGLAHDFNNLLMAVMGNISMATRLAKDDEKLTGLLNDALNASLSARELTQQLLTFSRGGEPVVSVESLGELVVRATDFIMSGSNIQVTYNIPDNLWNGMVDRGQFNQVIYNIVLNARQAMVGGGTLTCVARNFTYGEGAFPIKAGHYIRIDIIDNGPGMPSEVFKNIFDPFFSTKENGSGLGLAIAFSIVQKHGGHIFVESTPGKGSMFSIYLPASMEKAAPEASESVTDSFGKGRILVMDDDRTVADIAMLMLDHLGFEADWAKNGAEALERYAAAMDKGRPYRAVIMDLTIPGGMGGLEAVKALKAHDPAAIAFVSSGYSNDPVIADYHDHGFDDVLSKPYLYEDLARVLRRHLI